MKCKVVSFGASGSEKKDFLPRCDPQAKFIRNTEDSKVWLDKGMLFSMFDGADMSIGTSIDFWPCVLYRFLTVCAGVRVWHGVGTRR